MAQDVKRLMQSITSLWIEQIKLCRASKERHFDRAAREVMHYVGKEYRNIRVVHPDSEDDGAIGDGDDGGSGGEDITIMNYTQAFIDIMTPYVWAAVPNRLTVPRSPQIPPELELLVPEAVAIQKGAKLRDTMVSFLMQWWLNYAPGEYNLSREGKLVVQEAFGKGRGTMWLEMIDSPVGLIPGATADSVDNLFIDSDATQLRSAGFIIRKREQVNYKIAEIWNEDIDEIRGSVRTGQTDAVRAATGENNEDIERGDKGTYYEVHSLIGLGEKLVNASSEMTEDNPIMDLLSSIDPEVHFAIMPGLDHPLGMSADVLEAAATGGEFLDRFKADVMWPIKTFENRDNPWPMKPLDFRPHLKDPWASPVLEQAMPLQAFIDRIYQTLLNRAETAGRDIVLTSSQIEEDLENAIETGKDLVQIKVNGEVPEAMEKLVGFLRFPELKRDILEILGLADHAWRELTGMDPSQFGGVPRSQDRSAEATQVREAGLARRPDDYADAVEAWSSDLASGEAIAARMLIKPEVIAKLFHEEELIHQDQETGKTVYGPLTSLWIEYVFKDNAKEASSEVSYTVEAGSGRRRNKQLLQKNAEQLYQMLGQHFYDLGTATPSLEFDPYIALVRLVGDAYDMPIEALVDKFNQSLSRLKGQQQQQPSGEAPPQGAPPTQPPQQ